MLQTARALSGLLQKLAGWPPAPVLSTPHTVAFACAVASPERLFFT